MTCRDCHARIREATHSPRCASCRRAWRLRRDREYRLRQRALLRAAKAVPRETGVCLVCRAQCDGVECTDVIGCVRRASVRVCAEVDAAERAG